MNKRTSKSLFFMLFTTLAAVFTIVFSLIMAQTNAPNAASAAMRKENQILEVAYDNEVKSSFPNTVYSTLPYSFVGSDAFHDNIMRYYLYINLATLSKGKITSAVVYLDRASSTWDLDGKYRLHPVLSPWNMYDLTWNNQPPFSDSYIEGLVGQNGIYAFDITTFLEAFKGKYNEFYGFVLKKPDETGNNNGLFVTSDYSSTGSETRPYLEVRFK